MKQFDGLNNYIKNSGTILVLGMFDGLHLGHMALFKKAMEIKGDKTVTVLTFSNHFKGVKRAFKMIMTSEEKAEALKQIGVDELIMQRVNQKLMDTHPIDFVRIIKDKINVKSIVVGYDYTFGKYGAGDISMLKNNFDSVYVIDKIELCGEKISSTCLRECVRSCDFEKFEKFSEKAYSITGVVEHGNNIGSKNSTPTINVAVSDEKMTPPDGVYMTKVKINNETYKSISNLGSAPTFDRQKRILEVHILDFNKNVYNTKVEVCFYKRIRDVKKFKDTYELYEQISRDIKETRNFFKGLK